MMKLLLKLFAAVVLILATSGYQNSYGQDYYINFPLNITIGNSGLLTRIELSVYDSSLQTSVNYNTAWVQKFITITGVNNGKITYTYQSSLGNPPDFLGVIIYDNILHQFIEDSVQFNVSSSLRKNVVCGPIWVEFYYEVDNGSITTCPYVAWRYNMHLHKWIKYDLSYQLFHFSTLATFYTPLQVGNSDRLSYDDDYIFCMYDPIADEKQYSKHHFGPINWWTTEDQDVCFGAPSLNQDEILFRAYDPDYHQLSSMNAKNLEINMYDGVFIGSDITSTNKYTFAIYDIEQHIWVADSVSTLNITNLKSKNRIISYVSDHSGTKRLYAMAYQPLIHQWVKDSVQVTGAVSTLTISNGTISWVDGGGSHVFGYDASTGWGNYNTTKQMYFTLKDFTTSGYPYVYVKNYSLGTDSVYYDFGDGVVSENNRDVFWHQYIKNGNYTICLYDSSGLQSYCSSVSVNLCNFSGTAVCSSDTICAGDSVQLTVSGSLASVQ